MFLTSFVCVCKLVLINYWCIRFFAVTWQLYGSTHIRVLLTPPVCVRVCMCVWAMLVILLFHSHRRACNGNSDKGDSNTMWTHLHVFEFASYTVCVCVCLLCCVAGYRNETRSYNQYVVIYFRCLHYPLPSPSTSVCRFNARRAKFARMIRATLRIFPSSFLCCCPLNSNGLA